jgi:hypothetical protein
LDLGAANDEDLVRRIGIATGKEVSATRNVTGTLHQPSQSYKIFVGEELMKVTLKTHNSSQPWFSIYPRITIGRNCGNSKTLSSRWWSSLWNRFRQLLIDQGDTQLEEAELRDIHLYPYLAAINEADVLTVMISYSSQW